jgi:Ca2+-binding EF-hand superfamily protein
MGPSRLQEAAVVTTEKQGQKQVTVNSNGSHGGSNHNGHGSGSHSHSNLLKTAKRSSSFSSLRLSTSGGHNNHGNGHNGQGGSPHSHTRSHSHTSNNNGNGNGQFVHAPPQRQESNASAKSVQTSATNMTACEQNPVQNNHHNEHGNGNGNNELLVQATVKARSQEESAATAKAPIVVQAAQVSATAAQAPVAGAVNEDADAPVVQATTSTQAQIARAASILAGVVSSDTDISSGAAALAKEDTGSVSGGASVNGSGSVGHNSSSNKPRTRTFKKKKRLSAKAMLAEANADLCCSTTTAAMIDQYWKQPKLKQLTLLYWVQSTSCCSPDPEVERLRDAFAEHDPDGGGTILYADFQQVIISLIEFDSSSLESCHYYESGLSRMSSNTNPTRRKSSNLPAVNHGEGNARGNARGDGDGGEMYHIRTIFDKLDCEQDGSINYIEFLAVRLLSHQQKRSRSSSIVTSGNTYGNTTACNANGKYGNDSYTTDQLAEIFKVFDKDHNSSHHDHDDGGKDDCHNGLSSSNSNSPSSPSSCFFSKDNLRQTLEEDWAISTTAAMDTAINNGTAIDVDAAIDALVEDMFDQAEFVLSHIMAGSGSGSAASGGSALERPGVISFAEFCKLFAYQPNDEHDDNDEQHEHNHDHHDDDKEEPKPKLQLKLLPNK